MQFQEDDNVALNFKFNDLLGNVREKGLGVIIVVNNLNLFAFTKKALVRTRKKRFKERNTAIVLRRVFGQHNGCKRLFNTF